MPAWVGVTTACSSARWRVYPGVFALAMFCPVRVSPARCAISALSAVLSPENVLLIAGSQRPVDDAGGVQRLGLGAVRGVRLGRVALDAHQRLAAGAGG